MNKRDADFCYRVLENWHSGMYDAIHVKCYNKEEADAIREFVNTIEPKAKLIMSWIDFDKSAGMV